MSHQQQPPAIHGVGHRPAAQREDQDRNELNERQQADRERAVGQLPELERERHDRDLTADAADELAEPEHAEITVPSDRFQVHQKAAQAASGSGWRVGHVGKNRRDRLGRPEAISALEVETFRLVEASHDRIAAH